ncbi:MAG: hypothetical protein HQM10_16645 [Candidatus Riflebacteria bacterium]|nr:hypothetical protein [Candidatus Riflebacteria bacterium]
MDEQKKGDPVVASDSELKGNEGFLRIREKLDELEYSQKTANYSIFFAALASVSVVVFYTVQLLMPIYELKDKTQPLLNEIEKGASARFFPIIRAEFLRAVSKIIPAYQNAFSSQIKGVLPQIEDSISRELSELITNLEKNISSIVNARLALLLKKNENLLRVEFPEIENDQKVCEAVDKAIESALFRVLGESMLTITENFTDTLKVVSEIRVPQKIHEMSDRALQEHLIENINRLISYKIGAKFETVSNVYDDLVNITADLIDTLDRPAINPAADTEIVEQ